MLPTTEAPTRAPRRQYGSTTPSGWKTSSKPLRPPIGNGVPRTSASSDAKRLLLVIAAAVLAIPAFKYVLPPVATWFGEHAANSFLSGTAADPHDREAEAEVATAHFVSAARLRFPALTRGVPDGSLSQLATDACSTLRGEGDPTVARTKAIRNARHVLHNATSSQTLRLLHLASKTVCPEAGVIR